MKKNFFKTLLLSTLLSVSIGGSIYFSNHLNADTIEVNNSELTIQNAVSKNKNLLTIKTDSLGRPIESSFIGNDANQLGKRSQPTPPNPANLKRWTNQKLSDGSYLWNRGHLIGDQFAGHASNNPLNLVGETVYLNQVLMLYFEGGMKSSNQNALDNWLYLHPNYFIEYNVHVNWGADDENYPRSVTLKFRGIDKKGNPIEIKLPDLNMEGAGKQSVDSQMFTSVTLENIQPGYSINYITGKAVSGENSTQSTKTNQSLTNKYQDQSLTNKDKKKVFSKEEENIISEILKLIIDGFKAFVKAFRI